MNLNSKAKLLLWLHLPKIQPTIPLTALIIIAVFTQANAKSNTSHPFTQDRKAHGSGQNFTADVIKIEGKVTDEKGETLPGVSVRIKGATNGTTTNKDGNYTITVPDRETILVFSFLGYTSQEQKIGNSTTVNIVLTAKNSSLNEVVVVGYGTQKKGNIVGAVSTVKGEDLLHNASGSVSNALAGQVPGLIINTRSGEPGNDAATFYVRGLNTFSGSTSPLILIDGIPDRNFNRLNADDIESISVLKDASAAIYGVRAANGVILVTTKRGHTGKPTIHYDQSYSLQQLTFLEQRVNAWQYMTYYNELSTNQGISPPYPQSQIDEYKAGNNPNFTSTNWLNSVFRKNAPQQSYSLSVQGGGDQVKYYLSASTLDQQSNYANSSEQYKEFNIMSNVDASISDNLKLNFDITARKENIDNPYFSAASILHEAVSLYPFIPVYWQNGLPSAGVANGRNPVIMTSSAAGFNNTDVYVFNPKLGFDLKLPFITEGLSVNGYAAFDYNYQANKMYQQPWDAYTYDPTSKTYSDQKASTAILSLSQDALLTNENTEFIKVAYNNQFGKNSINAFVGYEQTTSNWTDTYAYRQNLLTNLLPQIFTGSTVNQNATGSAYQDARQSYLGRVTYINSNKYIAEVSLRENGSFNFAPNKQWGLFPSVSLGWKISDENFFKNNIKIFDELKLRGSWGIMGNDNIGQYLYLAQYQLSQNPEYYSYFGNYTQANNLYLTATPNPNVTWEKQDTKDVGFDARLLSNKLSVSFDLFRFLRSDILAQPNASVPLYSGLALPPENIGKSLNQGFDFSVKYNETKTVIKYNFGVNFTYAKSKILFEDESPNIPAWQKATGYAIDSYLAYQTKGIYHTQAEINNSPHLPGTVPGDLWIVSKDGQSTITTNDEVRLPMSPTPKMTFGILMGAEYKGFGVNLVWAGQADAEMMILPQGEGSLAAPPVWLYNNRWTPSNPNGTMPIAFNSNDQNNNVPATFWLHDASFLRLKTANLSYTLPENMLKKYGIGKVKVIFGVTNLLTFDGLKKYGVDPETINQTGVDYPQTRIYRLGLNFDL